MFKSWSKKKKVKTLFKLEFQATQVPKMKKSALMISLVPEDVGKPTVRLQKAAVQDGTCSWENPIYETVKLIMEQKTGKLHEKIYHFIVSTGSSKSGYLGEASIDLADFVAETKPLTVSLPLKFANSGVVLHVTIQKMDEATDQKDGEEHGAPFLSHDESLKSQLGNCSPDENLYNFAEDGYLNESTSQISEQNGIFRASTGSTATFSIQSSQPDLGLKSSSIHQEPASFHSHIRQKGIDDAITTKKHVHQRSNTYCSVDSASDGSLVDSTNSLEDNLPREKLQDASDDSIEILKTEIATLMRQAEVSELELLSLRKQLVKERKQGENQSRLIISLKEKKDTLEIECEQLKSQQKSIDEAEAPNRLHSEIIDTRVQLEEMRQELNYEKKISNDLQLQLQKTQDLNSELIYAVRDLEEMVEIKNREISDISTSEMNGDKNPETLEELGKEHNDSEEVDLLKDNIRDLNGEIDFYKKHKEELDMHMKQLTLDYELLKRENHDISFKLEQSQVQQQMTQNECLVSLATIKELESQIQRLEERIKKQAEDLSETLFSINELEAQVEDLEKELEKQAQSFEEDLNARTFAKTEQEQKAIRAEEALRKTRWNNAVTAERLQEDFRRLSVEMASKLEEHEKQAMKAFTEANELRLQKRTLEELLQKSNEELRLIKDQNEVQQQELLNQIHLNEKQIEKMSLELAQKSKQLEYKQLHGRENQDAFSMEIQMLRAEVERLTKEKYNFYEQAETEQIKTSISKREMLTQSWNKERGDLEKKLASAKKEAEKIHEEFLSMRSMKDEKETVNNNLLSEVEKLRAHHDELKHNLYKEDLEKENLRKQIFQLKHQLEKKEKEINSIEKKLMNCNGQSKERENGRKNQLLSKMNAKEGMSIQKEVSVVPHERRVETYLEKELKVSTFCTKDECNCTNFSSEVALLKERNKCMEKELKEMQERYSEISLKFAEVEGERQQLVMTVRNLKNGKKN
ncbi:hypothetical protein FH972_008318 [Carpinus fangiana]|uniref:C2 NT-type domain-containing protein n=1 Tax=Carpinus fangiana TaxID=176857 RepID=A0A5N6QYG0_9ROSI|nr:hypothetical protein FH972_008318 [Carpinus fangiana]